MLTVTGPALAASTATIDGSVILQGINGFGAFGQAATIANVGSATQQQALDLLFSQTTGPA